MVTVVLVLYPILYVVAYHKPSQPTKNLFKVSRITLEQRSNVSFLSLSRFLAAEICSKVRELENKSSQIFLILEVVGVS